jgi:hypothetical protein
LTNLPPFLFQYPGLTPWKLFIRFAPPAPPVPTGYFYLWLFATDMGVGNNPNVATLPVPGPLPVINPEEINIDYRPGHQKVTTTRSNGKAFFQVFTFRGAVPFIQVW